jgi:hypothetical protein
MGKHRALEVFDLWETAGGRDYYRSLQRQSLKMLSGTITKNEGGKYEA